LSPKDNERAAPYGGYAAKPRRPPRPGPPHLVHAGAVAGAVWAAAFATQYVAARLAYHPHLGPWLYRASSSARARFSIAIPVCLVAAGIALVTRRWRWAAIPLVLSTATAMILRDAPLYSPDRVFVWYKAYHTVSAYRPLFLVAWAIFAIATVAATIAAAQLAATRAEPVSNEHRQPDRHFDDDIIN
jgi:hypothetical protein